MRFALCAAAATMLSCAPVGAATIVEDFESYAVGTELKVFGTPYPFFGIYRGQAYYSRPYARIVDLGSNKALQIVITPRLGGLTYFDMRTFRTYPENNNYTPTLLSLDILAPNGLYYARAFGLAIAAGQWTTVAENWTVRTWDTWFNKPTSVMYGNGTAVSIAYIDNITYTIAVSPAPEPASWAMLLAGFGLMGATLRRRQTAPIAVR
jgi:hypothetical protein